MNNDTTIPVKTCTKCLLEKPATLEYFYKRKQGKYGLAPMCKNCVSAYQAIRYQENRERLIADSAAWYASNRERHAETSKAWRNANRERIDKNGKAWREANREHRKAIQTIWRHANPDKVRAKNHRRRALVNASQEHFTSDDLALQYRSQRGKCWHCGIELNNDYHADHLIPLVQGGSNAPDNIVCSCAPCNHSKSDKTVAQWKGRLF